MEDITKNLSSLNRRISDATDGSAVSERECNDEGQMDLKAGSIHEAAEVKEKDEKWNMLTVEVKALLDIRPRVSDMEELMDQVNEMLKTDDNLVIASDYQNIIEELELTGELWEDPEFLPEPSSLTYEDVAPKGIEWIRILDLHENAFFMTDGVSKSDIVQGELGDCWFWASVATIANSKRLTERVIPSGFDPATMKELQYCPSQDGDLGKNLELMVLP
uniref:uncharacterized protein n=1 Tax=Pristiophorus japonicus TaxID=55135 RepID=UPI00398EDDC2